MYSRSPQVTIKDVAHEAGVSITTVSHALSGRRAVAEETRTRVLRAAERLGYFAHPAARSLRTGRIGVIGLVFRPRDAVRGSLAGTEYHLRLGGAAATAAVNAGFGLLHVPDPLATPAQLPMDGCILVAPSASDELLSTLLRRDLPVVTADPDPDRLELGWWVGRDEAAGITAVLDHLWHAGARRIALLSGTDDNAWLRHSQQTYREWATANEMAPTVLRCYEGDGADGAAKTVAPLLAGTDRPDAVVAASSRFATGVVGAAGELGLAVPGELLVVALSDSELARAHTPSITALDLQPDTLGRAVVDLMLHRLEGADAPAPVRVQPVLHPRASTKG